MPGNSQRRGAMRKPGSKKGQTAGSGGQKSKGLKGKGPTPKASERKGHPAARRAAAAKRASSREGRAGDSRAGKQEYVVGRNSVAEALRARTPAVGLYVMTSVDADERVREAGVLARERGLPTYEVSKPELDRMTRGAVHQGLALQVPPYQYAHLDELVAADGEPVLVALDGVTDPRNLGAIVRSVAAFGGHGVIVPERRAAEVTASAWKASAGTAATVPVARVPNLARALASLRRSGFAVVGLAADGDAGPDDFPFAEGPLVLVVGSEGRGLSRLVRESCDALLSIPMAPGVESLNVSVATGIALYGAVRTRQEAARNL